MYRFLLRPRWIALILGVIVLVTVFSRLAEWQFGRNAERSRTNELIAQNLSSPPRPVTEVVAPGRPLAPEREWLTVRARGRYDTGRQLLVRYRHLDGKPGFEVLTPLVTGDGTGLLVNRGWIASDGAADAAPSVPAPPKGEVTVTGRIRRSEDGSPEQGRPSSGQVRFIDVEEIAKTLPYPVFGGYVELTGSSTGDGKASGTDGSGRDAADRSAEGSQEGEPVLLPPPELDPGPFFSYGVQWWLFAAIAVIGLIVLAYDEAHGGVLRERLRSRERRRDEEPTDRA